MELEGIEPSSQARLGRLNYMFHRANRLRPASTSPRIWRTADTAFFLTIGARSGIVRIFQRAGSLGCGNFTFGVSEAGENRIRLFHAGGEVHVNDIGV